MGSVDCPQINHHEIQEIENALSNRFICLGAKVVNNKGDYEK